MEKKPKLLDLDQCPICLHALDQGLVEELFREGKELQSELNELKAQIKKDAE